MKNKIEVFKVNLFVVFIKMIKEMKKKLHFTYWQFWVPQLDYLLWSYNVSFLKEVVDIAVTGDLSMIWLVLMKILF